MCLLCPPFRHSFISQYKSWKNVLLHLHVVWLPLICYLPYHKSNWTRHFYFIISYFPDSIYPFHLFTQTFIKIPEVAKLAFYFQTFHIDIFNIFLPLWKWMCGFCLFSLRQSRSWGWLRVSLTGRQRSPACCWRASAAPMYVTSGSCQPQPQSFSH